MAAVCMLLSFASTVMTVSMCYRFVLSLIVN